MALFFSIFLLINGQKYFAWPGFRSIPVYMPIFIKIGAGQVTSGPHFGDPLRFPLLSVLFWNSVVKYQLAHDSVKDYRRKVVSLRKL